MDPAGSLAVDEQRAARPVYYNVRPVEDPPGPPSRPSRGSTKKILSGRIAKKYRQSLKNAIVTHSSRTSAIQTRPS